MKTFACAVSVALTAGVAASQDTLEMTAAFGQNLPILGTAAVVFVSKINGLSSPLVQYH